VDNPTTPASELLAPELLAPELLAPELPDPDAHSGAQAPGMQAMTQDTGAGAVVLAVIVRPWLWATAVRQVGQLAPTGWWRRWPFLPLPDREYLAFRLQTAYGTPEGPPRAADVVGFLTWRRAWPRVTRRSH
jgi:hypothetical protein